MGIVEEKNIVVQRFFADYHFRKYICTTSGLFLSTAFAVFNGVIGIVARSAWYVTLAVYYLLLMLMRLWAVHEKMVSAGADSSENVSQQGMSGQNMRKITVYRNCSIVIILMTASLSGMVILTLHLQGGKQYPGMTIYVMALYTFIKAPLAVKNWLRARKQRTPSLLTICSISFSDACVSVMSLQTAMFASFGERGARFEQIMNGVTGGLVCLLVLAMGMYGVYFAGKMKSDIENKGGRADGKDFGSGR